jgi:hypothetical protein
MVGALVGGLIAQYNPWDHNEWNAFKGAKIGSMIGSAAGAVGGALAQTSPLAGLVLGSVGLVSGALVGVYAYKRENQ